jgi:predicted nucleotidyltransferase
VAYFQPILRALNDAKVEYVIVGGVATVLHGHLRVTADVDLVINLDRVNVVRTLDVLQRTGLRPRLPVDPSDFADPTVRADWVERRAMTVFSFYDPTNAVAGVDLFADDQQDFEGLWARSEMKPLGDLIVRVCSLDDLIAMKTSADRGIDRQDIEALKRIRDHA